MEFGQRWTRTEIGFARMPVQRSRSDRAASVTSESVELATRFAVSPTMKQRTPRYPDASRCGNFVLTNVAAATVRRSVRGTRNPNPSRAFGGSLAENANVTRIADEYGIPVSKDEVSGAPACSKAPAA